MPRNKNLKSVLILGAGPIVIGQGAEFDYSGTQACKALREEGIRIILINPNPATIMTDKSIADEIYIEPLEVPYAEKIIQQAKPDAILSTVGGQTALNLSLELHNQGILKKEGVELIGVKPEAITIAEDRNLFKQAMSEIGLKSPKSFIASTIDQAIDFAQRLTYPVVVRPSFTLGGSGGGIAYNQEQLIEIATQGIHLSMNKQILVEQCMLGYKEYEMEAVRDSKDNCIIVCSIENLDPMGVHTGDSIAISPCQTLTDKEIQNMRNATIKVLRKIGVDTGGSNVQFAVHPENGEQYVIEMNPRVSRSSALASKATGFPIARVATKLAIGYTLDEIKNSLTTGGIPASFEPTLDYVVTKIPRFNFEKFSTSKDELNTQMKSVGEVMAIGSNFCESLQKAILSLEANRDGFISLLSEEQDVTMDDYLNMLKTPTSNRLWHIVDTMRLNLPIEKIYAATKIDYWFLRQLESIVKVESEIQALTELTVETITKAKKLGFADSRIATLLNLKTHDVLQFRLDHNITPSFKKIDSCAAEFATETNYCYSTYSGEDEIVPKTDKPKIMVLGCGPNRIGQGIEFDYCCVHALMALREIGNSTIMVNCNPETVSTDFDLSDSLYFEPITLEHIFAIYQAEKPKGLIIQFGGQTPLKLVADLDRYNIPVLGSSTKTIDLCEDRRKFQKLVNKLNLLQPVNTTADHLSEVVKKAELVGFPLVIRPSYVLGGRSMEIVHTLEELASYLTQTLSEPKSFPLLLDSFLTDAIEVDIDAVCDGTHVFIPGIMQHIESAGVHSGDSACSLPPYSLPKEIQEELKQQTKIIALAIEAKGIINIQFAIKDNQIYIIEVNPRASRTIPFVSKSTGFLLAKISTKVICGLKLSQQNIPELTPTTDFYNVKESVFPFSKFSSSDILLGPEMKSTGEVMGRGETFEEAYYVGQVSAGVKLSNQGGAFLSLSNSTKAHAVPLAKLLLECGFELFATKGTHKLLKIADIKCHHVNKVNDGQPHIIDLLNKGEISLVINTTEGKQSIKDSYTIRRISLLTQIPITTTIPGAYATCRSLRQINRCTPRKL